MVWRNATSSMLLMKRIFHSNQKQIMALTHHQFCQWTEFSITNSKTIFEMNNSVSCLRSIFWLLNIINRDIGPAVRVFANGPGDLGSIPGRVIPKTLKMELDTTLLNTQHYKVRFKGKVEQSWEWSSALPYTLVK